MPHNMVEGDVQHTYNQEQKYENYTNKDETTQIFAVKKYVLLNFSNPFPKFFEMQWTTECKCGGMGVVCT